MASHISHASPKPHSPGPFAQAFADLRATLARWRVWLVLGWYDVVLGHRRTLIGPFWQTVQIGVWVLGLSLVFRYNLYEGYPNYLPYVACGVILWQFIAAMLAGGAGVFAGKAKLIRNINNPLLVHAFRHIVQNLARLLFQSPVFLLVLPFSAVEPSLVMLLALPGFAALLVTSAWVVPLMGLIGVRWRDTPHVMGSIMRFLFFTTPVFWVADSLGRRAWLATYNPFAHYLEVIRAPLLGNVPALESWLVVGAITLVGAPLTLWLFSRNHRLIVFWL